MYHTHTRVYSSMDLTLSDAKNNNSKVGAPQKYCKSIIYSGE